MSILDLRGPEFLQTFLTLFLLLVAAGLAFRWLMAGPFDDHPSHQPDLDPLEVAYLASGAKGATDAAIASLVHRGALGVRGSAPPRLKLADNLIGDAAPLEQTVYDAVEAAGEVTIRDVRRTNAATAEYLSHRLEQYQFLLDPMRRTVCHVVPIIAFVALLVLGIAKVVVGVSRGRPVAFLVGVCALVVTAAILFAVKVPRRTRRGTRFLNRLKRDHAALHTTATVAPSQMAYTDLALAFALYGPVVLSMGPLADLNHAMKRRHDGGSGCGSSGGCGGGSSSSSSSSSSSCGGGGSSCGGGGCGGCGGGGCGGS